jgi:hypothetical protein
MTAQEAPAEDTATTAPVPVRQVEGQVVDYYESILESVPDAGGDGIEGILEQIAAAQDATGLDDPWRAGGLAKYLDKPLVIQSISKMPSDFGSGLSYFLVVDGAERATGEKVTVTTGSLSVVAQLLKAWQLDLFPVLVIPRASKRPTKDGYYPQHLEFPQP